MWNFLFIFSSIGFFVSFLFALYRKYSYNLIPSFNLLISFDIINDRTSNENLFIDYAEQKEIELFNACYNPIFTSNLIDILNARNNILNYFNSIFIHYNILLDTIKKQKNQILEIKNFVSQKTTEIDIYLNDFTKVTSPEIHIERDVSKYINELNRYTDFSNANSYQRDCVTKTFDFWSPNMEKCPSGYIYSLDGTQTKNCLVFKDWDDVSFELRYKSTCKTIKNENTETLSKRYYGRLKLFIEKNSELISQMKIGSNELINIYEDLNNKINTEINNDNDTFINFTLPFSLLNGNNPDSNIYDLFDCGLLKDDLIDFYDITRNKLSKISLLHLFAFLISSLLNLIAIFLFLRELYLFKKEPIEEIEEVPPENENNQLKNDKNNNMGKKNKIDEKITEKEKEIISINKSVNKSNKSNKGKITNENKSLKNQELKGTKSKIFVSLGKNKGTSLNSDENSLNNKISELSDVASDENYNQKRETGYNLRRKDERNEDEDESNEVSGPRDDGSAMS